MKIHKYNEMMRYLTRKPVTQQNFQAALDVSSLKAVMPSAPGIPNPQDRILELADGGRIELAGGSVAKSTKNKLIDDFLKEELKNNKGKITNQSSADLAKKFNDKYPNKNFYFNGELSPVDHKSIHYRISNNPDFKKNITLIIGRRTDPVYEDKINKAIKVYKKLPEEQKRALRTGGVGHTGALDKFMEENDLFRESSKYGSKMNQKAMDKTLFGRKLNEAGVERPEAIPQEENIKNQKLRRKEIIGNIGSTGYEKHIEDFKRNLQDYLGIEKTKLSTGKKMFPLDLAHRTDIDQLHALNQKMDPSDLGVDYYKTNREGYKSIEGKLSDLYDEQNKLYKQAKKLDKVPESLSKKIFLNNDEILQTIGESPFKDRLKPITINPVTLEVKRGSVITDDITKQLGIGLVETPMNKIKIGSEEDAIIKVNLAQQVVDEANELGLIKNVNKARGAAEKFVTGFGKQKGLPGKYKLLAAATASPFLLAANPAKSKDTQTAMQDQVVEGQTPQPKLAEEIKYDSYAGFVKPDDPNVRASQSDVLYWIADNEIPEEVKEVGKMVGEAAAVIGGATVGLGLPDVKKTIEERKAIGKSPITGTLAKGFYRLGSPLATAAFTVPQVLDENVTATEIATDPLNYLGLATMETLGKRAGTIAAPAAARAPGILGFAKDFGSLKNVGEAVPGKLNAALRLGLNPRVIAGASRFLGIPGLIASTGYSLYDYLSNKNKESE
jgi:hypothetical protein